MAGPETPPALDWNALPGLAASRRFSLAVEARARDGLARRAGDLAGIVTVALCGSLGRLEAGTGSDVDCIVVSEAGATPGFGAVAAVLDELGLRPSKPWGIYRKPVAERDLLDGGALGSLDEPPEVFGKRLQLLLDARPIYREERFTRLQRALVDWYGTGFLEREPRRGWTYLVNDLSRYLHAYAAWQQYRFDRSEQDSWSLRQAKLRSTRIPTIAALMMLAGESTGRSDKRDWLCERLRQTPLERLHGVMARYDDAAFRRFAAAYERCHGLLRDEACRAALIAAGPDDCGAPCVRPAAAVDAVMQASGEVIRNLTAFMLDRRNDWDARFFERLIL